jgi:hypothetical protein
MLSLISLVLNCGQAELDLLVELSLKGFIGCSFLLSPLPC